MKEVVEFGRIRGIRVIPEFDVPGKYDSAGYLLQFELVYHWS